MISSRYEYPIVSSIFFFIMFSHAVAYEPLDPNGNITIKWDIISWTPDGYVARVTMTNFQLYRHITQPGWTIGWVWVNQEVLWSVVGAEVTEQGDCSQFQGNIPHCCLKNPTVVDLSLGVPYDQQVANCCKSGVLESWGQDPLAAVSAFQLSVGRSGTYSQAVSQSLPQNFTLLGPGRGYTCSQANIVQPTVFPPAYGGRRKTQAMMTWDVTCIYSQLLVSPNPSCCVSMTSFYSSTITSCPTCACSCQNKSNCVPEDSEILSSEEKNTSSEEKVPLLQCTPHMCPIEVHWHVKKNFAGYWLVKITITNFNYRHNYSQWTLVVQHPNLNNVTQVFNLNYKPLIPYKSINDTGLLFGIKYQNDLLMEAGPYGNVQSEILLKKHMDNTFTFEQGWAFPRRVYFNGHECMMPPPSSYPQVPNSFQVNPLLAFRFCAIVFFIMLVCFLIRFRGYKKLNPHKISKGVKLSLS